MDFAGKQKILARKSWFYRKTKKERHLLLGIALLILFSFSLIMALIITSIKNKDDFCATSKCITASAQILNKIDLTVDPCTDFYKFVCGKFVKNTKIPADRVTVNTFSSVRDKVQEQLRDVVEQEPLEAAPKQYHFVKKIFNMCMNTTAIELESLPAAKTFLRSIGGWPVLESTRWNEQFFNWTNSMATYRKFGISTSFFIAILVTSDLKNSTRRVVTIGEPFFDLDREYLIKGTNDPVVEAYYDYMTDLAVMFGANRQDALRELKETLEFEINLARICSPQEETRNLTAIYNLMTVRELQSRHPFIPWLTLINSVINIPEIRVGNEDVVVVETPRFLVKLEQLLKQTPKRVQANYIMRVTANNFVYCLTKQFRDRKLIFDSVLNGQTESKPRWQHCLAVTRRITRYPIEASYVRKYFHKDSKKQVTKIVDDIRSEFEHRLNGLDWMDDFTKINAIEKAAAVKAFVGYPEELLDDTNVEEYYSKMEFKSNNYFQSMIDYSIFYLNEYYSKLRKPVNKTDWREHAGASIVNAFYSSTENSIIIPAGILQAEFFEEGRPHYMNYGAIGSTIGHELIHGFDDEGSQYDKDGNLRNWWGEETKNSFLEKAKCIIEQYGNYTVSEIGLNVNGINTQGENIADLGGVIQAYLAYQKWVEINGPELPLPGLEFSPNQLFWISGAIAECEIERPESRKLSVSTGTHSPGVYRVNGVYSNTEYFAKDFKCPLGSTMNPLHKCSIW